jgi:apolipoprotein N-acyltransferase
MMRALAHEAILCSGWRRRGIAFAAGAVGALAMAPLDFFPAMIVPMCVAVWLIDGCVARSGDPAARWGGKLAALRDAAGAGWWLGFGYFVAGLWWLGAAFLVEADQFAWALPLGVLGLPAGLAFFTAFGFVAARLLWFPGGGRILALASGLGLSEWLRGHVLTGFPWNDLGMALGGNLMFAQAASLFGLYGLTMLSVAIFAAPATLVDAPARATSSARRLAPIIVAAVALVALGAFGALRLSQGAVQFEANARLRIMQPNEPEDANFRPENGDAILSRYLALSDRATSPTTSGIGDVTHLVWPESAFPFILSRNREALQRIVSSLSGGATLITGAARQAPPAPGSNRARYYNAIQIVTREGLANEFYDKAHLVPFGEYLPFGALLDKLGLRQFVHVPGGFEAGVEHALLRIPGLPAAAPLICYEAIFPDELDFTRGRPAFLMNVTNDGWFGRTSGPYQHVAQARLRTIEQGLPMIRAANTGISAIIDPYGRYVARLPLGVEGVLDGALPQPIAATPFSRAPYFIPIGLWVALLLLTGGAALRARRA